MSEQNATKKEFAAALRQLLKTKSFADIRIGALCELCQKNRKSFYYHFKDKYDLCGWILQSELFGAILMHGENDADTDIFTDACRYFYQNRSFYRKLLRVEGQNSFLEYFSELLGGFFTLPVTPYVKGDTEPAYVARFYADALGSALRRWLDVNEPMPPDRFAELLRSSLFTLASLCGDLPNSD